MICVLVAAVGCGGDTSITLPEDVTSEAPEETPAVVGDNGADDSNGATQEHKLKPRT